MKNIQFYKSNYTKYLILIIIFTLSFFLRYHDLMRGSLFMDEMDTFFISNPNLSFYETFQRNLQIDQYNFYQYLYKYFFLIFGYNDYNARLFTCIIGSIVTLAVYIFYKKHISENNKFLLAILLIFNIFLIDYSQEVRAPIFYCLFVIINIYYFLNTLENKNFINIFLYIISGVVSLIIMNFSIIVIFSQFIFIFFFKRKYLMHFIFYFSMIGLFFLILNFPHIQKQFLLVTNPNFNVGAIASLNLSTFYDLFFRYFFGSRISGLIVLVFLIYLLIINIFIRKNQINENVYFLLILLFFTYFIPTLFSLIITPLLLPRYIIYIVPIILIIISYLSNKEDKITYSLFIIIFLIINSNAIYQKFYLKKISKSNYNQMFIENKIKDQKIYILEKKNILYQNLFKNSIFSNKLEFSDERDLLRDKPVFFTGFCDEKIYLNYLNYEVIKIYKSKFLINELFCLYKNNKY